ncbi:DNA replication/repair protein RecF [Martelella lutilitoris]|uniref:DNA replication and repair protein RecF n=1 Tax=Martelella lutilitoris TaxID=2583532 RepID=A0A5C4JWL0_9HYPH|nr:DNA replication/repair protein RecF [Martelella lutilitoris]TNB49610.1 DNA replication/repair protein RecF [Martelella lutilitoris]
MLPSIFLTALKLTDFRNYPQASLVLDGRHVVLTGNNGSGKTNLIEAVSFLSPGRGMRRAAYGQVVRKGAPAGFAVFTELEGMEGSVAIGTGTDGAEGTGRKVRINGTQAASGDELLDHVRVIWLTPSMDGLFTGSAGDRRRFLDRMVLSIDPAHGRRVADFERAMRSRNRLLSERRMEPAWLSGLEEQMAGLGVAMALARRELLSLLTGLIAESEASSPFPAPEIALAGFFADAADAPAIDLEDRYRAMLEEERFRDAAAGRTLDGPHRSEMAVRHAQKDMDAALCSTGEQKALLLGLVLAHARLTRRVSGHPPVMLFDEVAAHLDEGRRAALFDRIAEIGGQAFMTGTDRSLFEALGADGQFFNVSDGRIQAD